MTKDFKLFKKQGELEGYLWENYNQKIFNEYHKDKSSRDLFICDISYQQWLVYKILSARDNKDEESLQKYQQEYYIIYED